MLTVISKVGPNEGRVNAVLLCPQIGQFVKLTISHGKKKGPAVLGP